jgi:hypothetical protein
MSCLAVYQWRSFRYYHLLGEKQKIKINAIKCYFIKSSISCLAVFQWRSFRYYRLAVKQKIKISVKLE